jgi:hypothetical protein
MPKVPELVATIRLAWADATPPAPGTISRPTYDDEGVAEYFTGKTWDVHLAQQLRHLDFAPNIFTEAAFAYYLAAYLIADLEDPHISDTNVERVLFWLSRESSIPSENVGPGVISRLSKAQRSALQEFIEYIQERESGLYEQECVAILRTLDEADSHA